jgi:hypothetical protein
VCVCVCVGVCCGRPAEKMAEAASVRDLLFLPNLVDLHNK